jgi:hypothetical protein
MFQFHDILLGYFFFGGGGGGNETSQECLLSNQKLVDE